MARINREGIGKLMKYWETRKHLNYYSRVNQIARERYLSGSILDVGGGIAYGCKYLEWFPEFNRTSVDIAGGELPGVDVVKAHFLGWEPPNRYDLVLCLQVIEHIPNAHEFARKLLSCGDTVIVSVPYKWPENCCQDHVHDPVDETKMRDWFGEHEYSEVCSEIDGGRRLICVYNTTARRLQSRSI